MTLCVGAIFAFVSFFVEAAYNFASLSARMQGVPGRGVLRMAYPFALLAIAAFRWIAIWLLTTEDPAPQSPRHLRAWSLRLLATATLVIVFMYVLGMVDVWRLRASNVSLVLNSIDLITTMLFWLHLRWIGAKFDLRGSRWRAMVAMIGTSVTIALLYVVPRSSNEARLTIGSLITNFQNVRWAMTVLWMVISALVVLRFALAFANEVRLDLRSIASAKTTRPPA